MNPVLKAIKERRNIARFEATSIDNDKLNAILDAGRWAPSWTNTQPWRFIVVKDEAIKEKMSKDIVSNFSMSITDAPISIVVCVNPHHDPFHFIEDGTNATQNMALAAQSLGIGTTWIGVFSLDNERNSSERKIKETLKIPKDWRIISILPLGIPKFKEHKTRKELSDIVDLNYFAAKEDREADRAKLRRPSDEIPQMTEPVTARDLERAVI